MATYVCTVPPPRPPIVMPVEVAPGADFWANNGGAAVVATTMTTTTAAAYRGNGTTTTTRGNGTATTTTTTTTTTTGTAVEDDVEDDGNISVVSPATGAGLATSLPPFSISTPAPVTPPPNIKEAIRCHDPTWPHVSRQIQVAAVPWSLLTAIGAFVTIRAPRKCADARVRLSKYEYGLASSGMGPAMAVLSVHLVQCFAYALRVSRGMVDPIYYALEIIGSLYIIIDIGTNWMFVMSCGLRAVLVAAFTGPLLLDALVSTSVISLAIEGDGVGLTYFSFSFLAGVRIMRVVENLQRFDASRGGLYWRRQVAYNFLTTAVFVFVASALVSTLEVLQTPLARGSAEDPAWDLIPTLVFVLMSVLSVGSSSLVPRTALGQFFAACFIFVGYFRLLHQVGPLVKDFLLGKNMGLGSFRPTASQRQRFLVVIGTPTAPMLWDFILETYHPNHFETTMEFNQFAPQAVVMLPDRKTLAHMQRFLMRREALFFRSHVKLLYGDVFSAEDFARAAIPLADRVVVLPNFNIANVAADDTANLMRTLAINRLAPDVPVTCMVHSASNGATSVGATSSALNDFVSIDSFKLSMMARACLTRGFMTLICNLCKTVGDTRCEGEPWQHEYQQGLGAELYELPLSKGYEGVSFAEACFDIASRSLDGDVRLIGLTEQPSQGKRRVRIHPGADYEIKVYGFGTCGIFIAPDIGAVVQVEPRNPLRVHQARFVSKDRGRPTPMAWGDDGPSVVNMRTQMVPFEAMVRARRRGECPDSPASTSMSTTMSVVFKKQVPPTEEEKEQAFVRETYGGAMRRIKQRLMVRGFRPDFIGTVTGIIAGGSASASARAGADVAKAGSRARSSSAPPAGDEWGRPSFEIRGGEGGVRDQVQELEELQQMGTKEVVDRLRKLRNYHGMQETMDRLAMRMPPLPRGLAEKGGHLLLCIVGESPSGMLGCTDGSGPASAEQAAVQFGPPIGIEHFMRPLRDKKTAEKVRGFQDMQPSVVVLAERLPEDWRSVVGMDRVFFVRGSPLVMEDLELAVFRKARAITIVRSHRRESGAAINMVSDAQMVLAAHMIESELPKESQTAVLTDHAFLGTCDFLPTNSLIETSTFSRGQINDMPLPPFESPWAGVFNQSNDIDSNTFDDLGTAAGPVVEDYEELEATDYAHHPRYIRGDMFVTGALTSLVANTLYNATLLPLVAALIDSSSMLLPLPIDWERRSFSAFAHWLLTEKNMLALGVYRSSKVNKDDLSKERKNVDAGVTMHYVYTSPPGRTMRLFRSDRILALAPSGIEPVGSSLDVGATLSSGMGDTRRW